MVKKLTGLNQPNMMHLTGDGRRMYVTNSLLSTMDKDEKFWVKRVNVTKGAMALDETFVVDLTKFKTGPARGHDMLLY
jgi:selenium-binding protein 1